MSKNILKLSDLAAYANTLTGLIPTLYQGLDVVSRELVGFIPSVTRNVSAERAAVGEPVTWPVTPGMSSFDIAPAMQTPEPSDVTVGTNTLTITKSKAVAFGFVGEEQRGLLNGGNWQEVQSQLFAQAVRTLVNEIETDLAVEAALNACRAFGTPGTTPFATSLNDSAQAVKMLADNGAPTSGRSLIIDTTAGASLRTLSNLTRVNEAGSSMTLRDGTLLDLHGFMVKESAAVTSRAVGTASGATTNNAGYAVGATTITLASAGTGTVLTGDYVTFAGDTNKYLVETGDTDVSNGGTITLAAPGLRVAVPASNTAITVVSRATRNIALVQSAMQLVTRAPALPDGKDAASDAMMITDPRSGIAFEVRVYEGYRKVRYEVGLSWGVKASKKQHIVAMLG